MSGDVPKITDTPAPTGTAAPDSLNDARLSAGPPANQTVADNATAAVLPNTTIDIDTPYNPYNIPGTYNPADINFAKSQGFNADEIHLLEEGGADRFHQTMAWVQARPDVLQGVKGWADGEFYLQTHPDAIFNPLNVPGTYNPDAIQFGKDQGFNPDQMHVLEEWGPQNFNGIMDWVKQNPSQLDNMKNLANAVGYWQTHPDMPLDPKAQTNQYNPDAVKFGQSSGFTNDELKLLGQWGADNFNNSMAYLQKNPDQVANFKKLADAVGTWETNMTAGTPAPTAPGQ
jgi:hypothetical protein